MLRRVTMAAGGIAIALMLCPLGTTPAWASLSHIKNGSEWTFEVNQHGCEIETFSSNGTFKASGVAIVGDEGKWSGGDANLKMKWKGGQNTGLTFAGTFNGTVSPKEFAGDLGGTVFGETGQLVKGAMSEWNGAQC
jgi:hypothetical protein